MFIPGSFAEQLVFGTVRIEAEAADGSKGYGTAFRFQYPIDAQHSLSLLVTNKHVVRGAVNGRFVLHTAIQTDGFTHASGEFYEVVLDDFEQQWYRHPDPDVDLCALLLNPIRNRAEEEGTPLYDPALSADMIWPDDKLESLAIDEQVTMVGYPNALWDHVNNLPLLRKGTTATHPAIDFCGKSVMVIDIACFPGSSGSPVLLINQGGFPMKGGRIAVYGGDRVVLFGVLYGGPVYTSYGDVEIREIPTVSGAFAKNEQMINLGYIVKSKEIKVLGEAMANEVREMLTTTAFKQSGSQPT